MKQPRKAQLRRKIERLTRRLDTERQRADHAETLRAFDHQLVDSAQAKLAGLERWAQEIVDILNLYRPASALLPRELKTRSVPPNIDYMVTSAVPSARVWEKPNHIDYTSPVTLVHLKMFLEDHPEAWNRLVEVSVQDRTSADPTFRHSTCRHAISREFLMTLLLDKSYFVEHVLRTMGTQLFHHLNKTK